mgnify:CR=1 FL=1
MNPELLPSRASASASTSESEDFGPLFLADFISPALAQFLGVRSLVCFGATSKSNRSAVPKEVGRRKMRIAEAEVEVARLMTSQEQTAKLSAYINRAIDLDDGHGDDGLNEMYSLLEEESGEEVVRNPTREHFSAAKKIIYDAMRLIDDEIGIFTPLRCRIISMSGNMLLFLITLLMSLLFHSALMSQAIKLAYFVRREGNSSRL